MKQRAGAQAQGSREESAGPVPEQPLVALQALAQQRELEQLARQELEQQEPELEQVARRAREA